MFDRYIIRPDAGPKNVTVHEHRAPTADSVRLAREFEAAAEKKVLDAVRVENTLVECVVHSYEDFLNDRERYKAVLKINGVMREATHECGIGQQTQEQIALALRDAVAKVIATEMIGASFKPQWRRKP